MWRKPGITEDSLDGCSKRKRRGTTLKGLDSKYLKRKRLRTTLDSLDGLDSKYSKQKKKFMSPPAVLRVDRSYSCGSEVSMSQVSPRIRVALLGMERMKIRDPFSEENQDVIHEFGESVHGTSLQDMNLTEMALLLRGVMSIWKRQTGTCITDIHELAAFVTNTQAVDKFIETQSEETDESKMKSVEESQESKLTETESPQERTVETTPGATVTPSEEAQKDLKGADPPSEFVIDGAANAVEAVREEPSEDMTYDVCTEFQSEPIPSPTSAAEVLEVSAISGCEPMESTINSTYSEKIPDTILNDNSNFRNSMNTRKRPVNYADLLRPDVFKHLGYDEELMKPKKPRKLPPPPILVSCFDLKIRNNISDDDLAPILTCQVLSETQTDYSANSNSFQDVLNGEDMGQCNSFTTEVGVNIQETAQVDLTCLFSKDGIGDEVSPEDISVIQKLITQLHYLPFKPELTNEQAKKAFKNLLENLSATFKKYRVPVGKMMTSDSSAQPHISSTCPEQLEIQATKEISGVNIEGIRSDDQNSIPDESSAVNTKVEADRTIMDTITEKTSLESQVRMKEMILGMQKSIVPKYARIPLIQENTAEFFRRVKLFEDKMKKVLAFEEKKGDFDVSKYEMEVLDAANRETQEPELGDLSIEMQVPSPISNCTSPERLAGYEDNFLSFHGLPSPSSSESSDSQKWVSLTQIFTHMKKMEKREAARVFYAILALLSFENLDIKYDNYYSPESAAITSKCLDHAQDSKYPRGLKIMSSRCPNVDREEIFLAPLTSQSRTNSFRQIELRESTVSTRSRSYSTCSSRSEVVDGDLTHDIDREFIRIECPKYDEELFRRARSKKKSIKTVKERIKKIEILN